MAMRMRGACERLYCTYTRENTHIEQGDKPPLYKLAWLHTIPISNILEYVSGNAKRRRCWRSQIWYGLDTHSLLDVYMYE